MRRFKSSRTWSLRTAALLLLLSIVFLLPTAVLAQPDGPPSVLDPASPNAALVLDLHNIVLLIAAAVFVVVEGVLVIAAIRFRGRSKDGREPPQIHGNRQLELAWTIVPSVIVVALFVLTIRTQQGIDAQSFSEDGGPPLKVEVVGHQWWWEFRYPERGITTAGNLVIPVGRVIDIKVSAPVNDVIHSFWVPELNGKADATPGVINTMWFKADRAGEYFGQCAELCGISHGNMRFVVTALPNSEFESWAGNQAQDADEPTDAKAQAGLQVFLSAGCVGCHVIRGVDQAVGVAGPDLTHVAARPYIAGGILLNTEHNLTRWLEDPPGIKAGSLMPNLGLATSDIESLVAYLQTLE